MRLCVGDQIEINRRFNKEICDWLGDEGIAHAINRIQSLGETEKILHLRLWFGDEEVYWTGKPFTVNKDTQNLRIFLRVQAQPAPTVFKTPKF